MPLSTPRRDLWVGFRTHLSNQASFVALGLKTFWFYDGRFIPHDWKTGRIDLDAMPALSLVAVGGGRRQLQVKGRGISRTFQSWIKIEGTFIYPCDEGDGTDQTSTLPMDQIDNAMDVLADCLDTRQKEQQLCALLGGGSFLWEEIGPPQAGKNGPTAGAPRLWAWKFNIELRGPSFHR